MKNVNVLDFKPGWVRLIPKTGYALFSKRTCSVVSEAYVKKESMHEFAAIPK